MANLSSNIVLTKEHLDRVVEIFLQHDAFVFDFEAMGEHRGVPTLNTLSWVSLATNGVTVVIPFGHPIGDKIVGYGKEPRQDKNGKTRMFKVPQYEAPPKQLSPSVVFEALRPLFFSNRTKVGHGVIYDLISCAKYFDDEIPPGPYFDTIVGEWVLDENIPTYKLKMRTQKKYGFSYDDEEVGKCVEKHPFKKVAYYSYCDAKWPWIMYKEYSQKIKEEGLESIFRLEMDVLSVLCGMKVHGARVDVGRMKELEVRLAEELEVIEADLYRAAGKIFNVRSSPQKQHLLFDSKKDGGQGLKPWKLTDGGKKKKQAKQKLEVTDYSTDAEVLESFPDNPVAATLLKYQEVSKILGTYIKGYLGVPDDPKHPCIIFDEHVHADFVQYGAKTGRFSCREPNLQNIPRPDTELGKLVRGLFVAEPGSKLIVADYGQIELVVLAHYLGKGRLYNGFLEGIDPHIATAAGVLGKHPEKVTRDERQLFGKTLNFAVLYGVGPQKLAGLLSMSTDDTKDVLQAHADSFPEIYQFKNAVLNTCRSRKPPYIQTLLGRRRRLPAINSTEFGLRGYAERQAFNSLIQGGNADIIKLAMVRTDSMLPEDIQLILTVHDELVLSCPDSRVDEGVSILREAMLGEGIQKLLKVKLSADIMVVDRWSEAKD